GVPCPCTVTHSDEQPSRYRWPSESQRYTPAARSITNGSSAGQSACWVNGCHTAARSRETRSTPRSLSDAIASGARSRKRLAVVDAHDHGNVLAVPRQSGQVDAEPVAALDHRLDDGRITECSTQAGDRHLDGVPLTRLAGQQPAEHFAGI